MRIAGERYGKKRVKPCCRSRPLSSSRHPNQSPVQTMGIVAFLRANTISGRTMRDTGDWTLIGCMGGFGMIWALLAVLIWDEWWNSACSSPLEQIAQTIALWPLVAASFIGQKWQIDAFVLALLSGLTTGIAFGVVGVIWLRTTAD